MLVLLHSHHEGLAQEVINHDCAASGLSLLCMLPFTFLLSPFKVSKLVPEDLRFAVVVESVLLRILQVVFIYVGSAYHVEGFILHQSVGLLHYFSFGFCILYVL